MTNFANITTDDLATLDKLTAALDACNSAEHLKDANGVSIASQRGLYGVIWDAIEAIAPGAAVQYAESGERPAVFVRRRQRELAAQKKSAKKLSRAQIAALRRAWHEVGIGPGGIPTRTAHSLLKRGLLELTREENVWRETSNGHTYLEVISYVKTTEEGRRLQEVAW
jgi:hypothetical protein